MADRPDFDPLIANLRGLADLLTGLSNRVTLRRAADALESEQARADRAERKLAKALEWFSADPYELPWTAEEMRNYLESDNG